MDELRERGAVVRTGGNKPMDMIFALFRHRNDLRRLPSLVPRLKADGVLWTLRPKGSEDLKEAEMMRGRPGCRARRREGRQLLGRAHGREVRDSGRETALAASPAVELGERHSARSM